MSSGSSREFDSRASSPSELVAALVQRVVGVGQFTYLGHFEIVHRLVVGSRSLSEATVEGRPLEARKGRWHAFMSHEQDLTQKVGPGGGRALLVSEVAVCHESTLAAFRDHYDRSVEVGEVAVDGAHVTLMDSAVFDESTLVASALASGDGSIAGANACVIRCHAPGHYPLYLWTEEGVATFVSLSLI